MTSKSLIFAWLVPATIVVCFLATAPWPGDHECQMSWMWPTYSVIRDAASTNQAGLVSMPYEFAVDPHSNSSWQLLRFRDQKYSGRLKQPQKLIGPPVLFVLGHMGHFGQARSVATQGWFAAYLAEKCHQHAQAAGPEATLQACAQVKQYRAFETFVLDTSNMPVGVSGGLLLAQSSRVAEAILTIRRLYSQDTTNVQGFDGRVHIVAHSMGAIAFLGAASGAFFSDSAASHNLASISDSIASVTSLAAPLHIPPVPLSPAMLLAYAHAWCGMNALQGVPHLRLLAGARDRLLWFGELWRGHDADPVGAHANSQQNDINVIIPALKPVRGAFVDHVSVTWCRQAAYGIAQSISAASSPLGSKDDDTHIDAIRALWRNELQHGAHSDDWAPHELRRQNGLRQMQQQWLAAVEGTLRQLFGTVLSTHIVHHVTALRSFLMELPEQAPGGSSALLDALRLAVHMGSTAALPAASIAGMVLHLRAINHLRPSLKQAASGRVLGVLGAALVAVCMASALLGRDVQVAVVYSTLCLSAWYSIAALTAFWPLLWGGCFAPAFVLLANHQYVQLVILGAWVAALCFSTHHILGHPRGEVWEMLAVMAALLPVILELGGIAARCWL